MKTAYKKIYFKDQQEWLKIRTLGIGGSDIGAIMGYNKYLSPRDIYLRKVEGTEQKETEQMYWGKILEPIIADEFCKQNNFKLIKTKNFVLQSKKYPFLIASVDGIIVDKDGNKGILEIKTTSEYTYKSWQMGLPPTYYLQLQHYLLVSGFDYGYIALLIGGNKLEKMKFVRDEETIDDIINSAKDFWFNYVIPKIEPPNIISETSEIPPEGTIEANIEILELYNHISDLEMQIKALNDQLEEEKQRLKILINDYEVVTRDGKPLIYYKLIKRNVFDSKKFAEENPILYQQYLKEQTIRQLKIIKGEE